MPLSSRLASGALSPGARNTARLAWSRAASTLLDCATRPPNRARTGPLFRRHFSGGVGFGSRDALQAAAFLREMAPPLDDSRHKGQGGRVGVLGGGVDFSGAPYYSAISSLRTGAELLFVLTAEEAASPIKTYSPEMMVRSVFRFSDLGSTGRAVWHAHKIEKLDAAAIYEQRVQPAQRRLVQLVKRTLPKLHTLTVGPGLGRDPFVLEAVGMAIRAARDAKVPMVIDADALHLVSSNPSLVRGAGAAGSGEAPVVLTPNARELAVLAEAVCGRADASVAELARALGGPIVLAKGPQDIVCGPSGTDHMHKCSQSGAPRRPGGLGDTLSGVTSTLVAWAAAQAADEADLIRACHAASTLVRLACEAAYVQRRRSMVAPDVIDELGAVFENICPAPNL